MSCQVIVVLGSVLPGFRIRLNPFSRINWDDGHAPEILFPFDFLKAVSYASAQPGIVDIHVNFAVVIRVFQDNLFIFPNNIAGCGHKVLPPPGLKKFRPALEIPINRRFIIPKTGNVHA